jgi:hypothetical protein
MKSRIMKTEISSDELNNLAYDMARVFIASNAIHLDRNEIAWGLNEVMFIPSFSSVDRDELLSRLYLNYEVPIEPD